MPLRETITQTYQILLVEDSRTQAMLVEFVIEELDGMNLLKIAHDGVEAMEYLRGECNENNGIVLPNLILLDINMPRKNGFEVLQELKEDTKLRRIPVVILTTSKSDDDVTRAYEAGAAGFISKPVELCELQDKLTRFAEYWLHVCRLPSTDA